MEFGGRILFVIMISATVGLCTHTQLGGLYAFGDSSIVSSKYNIGNHGLWVFGDSSKSEKNNISSTSS